MKETYYFSHDYNPTSDPKIQAMIGTYGAEGYGIYWRIIEMLHSENEHKLLRKKYTVLALARQMLTTVERIEIFVQDCIDIFELLETDENFIWSNRVLRNIENRRKISEIRSSAGKKSVEVRNRQQNAKLAKDELTHLKQNSIKERKEKENKENTTLNNEEVEVRDFFTENIKQTTSKANTKTVKFSSEESLEKLKLDINVLKLLKSKYKIEKSESIEKILEHFMIESAVNAEYPREYQLTKRHLFNRLPQLNLPDLINFNDNGKAKRVDNKYLVS